jgi:hypothetical protein
LVHRPLAKIDGTWNHELHIQLLFCGVRRIIWQLRTVRTASLSTANHEERPQKRRKRTRSAPQIGQKNKVPVFWIRRSQKSVTSNSKVGVNRVKEAEAWVGNLVVMAMVETRRAALRWGLFGDGGDIRAWWRTGGCRRSEEWTNGDLRICVFKFGMQGKRPWNIEITHLMPSRCIMTWTKYDKVDWWNRSVMFL